MRKLLTRGVFILCLSALFYFFTSAAMAQTAGGRLVSRFELKKSGLELERRTQIGSFFDVVGRRSAVFGYENRALEAWVYPLKIIDDFNLSFRLEGYPLDINGPDIAVSINVRPEATTFTYSHAAFTVRQIIFAPIDEAGIIMLLDVNSVLPMTITGSFRPKLRLMWPAGLMTGYIGWDENAHVYSIGEESRKFVGMIGSPAAHDISVMPYQEEPRDVPVRFVIDVSPSVAKSDFIPIVIAGSVEGRATAKDTYDRLLASAQSLYERNVSYYKQFLEDTTSIETPDKQLNTAFSWAKIGVDKGFATNPHLGTGLLAGFRTSGDSERPGFAWFFGRDSLWTSLAITSYGDYKATRTALDFLKKYQREDGKIPHEISQSAGLIPWFKDYGYPWASADATPLYIIAHGDYWRTSGNLEFIKRNWESILKAYRFTAATDTDRNGLIENTNFGHGWVEGGALYPPHEEIYMQGLWIEALRSIAELADQLNDKKLAAEARASAERTQSASEKTYWLADRAFYAFATNRPQAEPRSAEPGPNRDRRQSRLNEISRASLIDEDTVLPAVPLWWRTLGDERAQSQLDHLGSGAIATDWGTRIISNSSMLYDPLSYHYGSVWPLFTGWSSMAAYRYGRPQIGYQALMANALLTYSGALGYVTELLSGDFNSAFGRSSHHQVWSEAMVVTPIIRGLLGIEVNDGGNALTFAPQLPANWDRISVANLPAGDTKGQLTLEKTPGVQTITVFPFSTPTQGQSQTGSGKRLRVTIAPAFPLDARIRSVSVNGQQTQFKLTQVGDIQRAEITFNLVAVAKIIFNYDEGTEVYIEPEALKPAQSNHGIRVLRASADASALRLLVEGLGGREYKLGVRTSRRLGDVAGVRISSPGNNRQQLQISFAGSPDKYVRREVLIPMQSR
ncbi:MAG TPA: GH116 family glycosyl hydrolase [Blastocatellia bacterium]|nr:GH116 family glycosyl hydrolase [Blastocatellia bacterium]